MKYKWQNLLLFIILLVLFFSFSCERRSQKRGGEKETPKIKKESINEKEDLKEKIKLPVKPKEKVKVDYRQNGFSKIIITIYKERDGKKIYLGNKDFNVDIGNREISYKTNFDGMASIEIPSNLWENLDQIIVYVDNEAFKIHYKRMVVDFEINTAVKIISYNKFDIYLRVRKYKMNNGEKTLIEEKNFEGKVLVTLDGDISKTKYTGDGVIHFNLSEEEMRKVVNDPVLKLSFDNGAFENLTLAFDEPTGRVELRNIHQTRNNFNAILFNGTFTSKKVRVRAGYVRYGDKWFIGNLSGRAYFQEKEFNLLPGEKKSVSLMYDEPIWGTRSLRYKLEEVKN